MKVRKIPSGRPDRTVLVWVMLLVQCFIARAGAQDKGQSNRVDQDNTPKKAQPALPQTRTGDSVALPSTTVGLTCVDQAAVSELGCVDPSKTKPTRSSATSPEGSPGSQFRGNDFWSSGPSAIASAASAAPVGYRQWETLDLRRLSEQFSNPMVSVAISTFETRYSSTSWGIGRAPDPEEIIYRTAIPFNLMGIPNTLRVRLPYAAAAGGPGGAGNVELVDLLEFSNRWGQWGVGPGVTFGASNGFTVDTFRAGPAFAFVAKRNDWLLGALNKNMLSKNAAVSSIQPIVTRELGRGWSLGTGGLEYQIDWHQKQFASVPVGFEIGKVVGRGSQYYRFSVSPQYSVRNIYGSPRWTVTISVAMIGQGR